MTTAHPWAGGPHPWRAWRDLPHMHHHWAHLPGTLQSATDGVKHVWFEVKTLQVERRCNARHELEHVLAGHQGCVPGFVEDRIRWKAAKWLVPNPHVVADALIGAGGELFAAADHLWLDLPTLKARLDHRFMHPAERAIIQRKVSAELHP